jgi:hypothetical protein
MSCETKAVLLSHCHYVVGEILTLVLDSTWAGGRVAAVGVGAGRLGAGSCGAGEAGSCAGACGWCDAVAMGAGGEVRVRARERWQWVVGGNCGDSYLGPCG